MANRLSLCLWFDDQAEEVANFYTSIFKNSKILNTTHYAGGEEVSKVTGKPDGSVLTVEVELDGLHFTLLNGGPLFKFSEAVSVIINCEDQAEVDYYWEKLSAVPESEQCGWLKDKFGVSWQVVPKQWDELISKASPEQAAKLMQAMMQMKKLDVAKLEEVAAEGK